MAGATAIMVIIFVVVPALSAVPQAATLCDPRHPNTTAPASLPPGVAQDPAPTDPYDPNTQVFVIYQLNTGAIHSAYFYDVAMSGPGEPVLAQNEGILNISADPNRDALMDEFMCGTAEPLSWQVDPWAGVLIRA